MRQYNITIDEVVGGFQILITCGAIVKRKTVPNLRGVTDTIAKFHKARQREDIQKGKQA